MLERKALNAVSDEYDDEYDEYDDQEIPDTTLLVM